MFSASEKADYGDYVVQGRRCPAGFPFKRGWFIINFVVKKKYCVSMRVLNLFQDLFVSCLKVLVGVRTKNKPLGRTDNSSSVNVWLETLCIMFLLYWEVYIFMDLVVNLRNKDLHWFCGKRTFIDTGCIYVLVGVQAQGLFLLFSCEFCIFSANTLQGKVKTVDAKCFFLVLDVSFCCQNNNQQKGVYEHSVCILTRSRLKLCISVYLGFTKTLKQLAYMQRNRCSWQIDKMTPCIINCSPNGNILRIVSMTY